MKATKSAHHQKKYWAANYRLTLVNWGTYKKQYKTQSKLRSVLFFSVYLASLHYRRLLPRRSSITSDTALVAALAAFPGVLFSPIFSAESGAARVSVKKRKQCATENVWAEHR